MRQNLFLEFVRDAISTHMARLDCKSGDFDSCLIHDFFFGAKVTVARLDQLDTQLGTTRKVDYIFRS